MNTSTAAYITLFTLTILLYSCTEEQKEPDHFIEFIALYEKHKYSELADKYYDVCELLSGTDSLLASAVMYSVFNKPDISNKILSSGEFRKIREGRFSRRQLIYLQLLHQNYVLQNRYASAYETAVQLLQYSNSSLISSGELSRIRNLTRVWQSLYDVPAQGIESSGEIVSDLYHDKAGLMQVPVRSGSAEYNFVLDTGAELSVVSRTAAQKLGLKIIEDNYTAGTTTGRGVAAVLGVAEQVIIAGVEFRNVVFFVLEDDDLYFEHRDYRIDGIVGLPVIKAMNKLTFGSNSLRIRLDAVQKYNDFSLSNIFFSGSSLVTSVKAGHTGLMLLDTGSWNTVFYLSYYRIIKDTLTSYSRDTVTIYGAGNEMKTGAVIIKKLHFEAAGQKITAQNVPIYLDPAVVPDEYIFGTLGADIFTGYDNIELNFEKMIFEAYNARM